MATNEQIALVLALIDNSFLFIVFLLLGFGPLLSNGRLIDFWSIASAPILKTCAG